MKKQVVMHDGQTACNVRAALKLKDLDWLPPWGVGLVPSTRGSSLAAAEVTKREENQRQSDAIAWV